jgi:hypothetical protein
MPGVKSKSGLSGRLGGKLNEAVVAHREDETTFGGGGGLPGGIENGIAQVVECKFGTYEKGDNKGEYFFYAAATVVLPKMHDGIPVYGLRTQIGPEPICDTPGKTRQTLEEHVAWVLNEFRKLGVDTTQLGADDIEPTAEAIKQAAPFTRFRTSTIPNQVLETKAGKVWIVNDDGSGKPKGPYKDEAAAKAANSYVKDKNSAKGPAKVFQQWTGAVPDFQPDLADGVVDEGGKTATEANVESNGQEQWDKDAASDAAGEAPADDDIESLVAAANSDDSDAMERLKELAIEAGKTEKDVKNADSWDEVAGWIAESSGEVPAGDEADASLPEKGSIWFYRPTVVDPKTKKQVKSKKATEHEVTSVDAKGETVTLKNCETGKTVIGSNKKPSVIPWSDLEQGE